MISFKPLLRYLREHEISMYQMIKDGVITPTESTRIRADHNFRLSFVGKLCEYLKCRPEDIIELFIIKISILYITCSCLFSIMPQHIWYRHFRLSP